MTTSSGTPAPDEEPNDRDVESEEGKSEEGEPTDDYSKVAGDDVVDDTIEFFGDEPEETPFAEPADGEEQPPPPNA